MGLSSVLPFLAALKKQVPDMSGMTADPGPVDMTGNVNAPSQVAAALNPPAAPPAPPPPPPDPQPDMSIGAPPAPQQPPPNPIGDIAQSQAQGDQAPKLAPETKGHMLLKLLQGGLVGGLSGLSANAATYGATGRNAGFGGGAAAGYLQALPMQAAFQQLGLQKAGLENQQLIQMLPFLRAQQIAGLQVKSSEAQKNIAEAGKAGAEAGAIPVKTQLEQAQTQAAYYKDDPNLGLIDIRTGQPVAGNAGTAPLTAQEAAILGKQPGESVPLKIKNTANEMVNRGIKSVSANGRQLLVDNQGNTIQDLGQATPMMTSQMRIEGMGQNREYPVLDTQNNNALQYLNANDLNTANKSTPGRYVPAGEGAKTLGKTALIEDIRGNIQSVRQSLQNPQMPEFTAGQRAQLAIAMNNPSPTTAISAALRGGMIGNLTPEQQDYVIHLSQLVENSMAMRSVLGAGQGSEDMRSAIRATIPNPTTPTKQYAGKQLDAFEAVLNRLSRGIPTVPLKNSPQGGGPPAGATMKVRGSDGNWHWSDGKNDLGVAQ